MGSKKQDGKTVDENREKGFIRNTDNPHDQIKYMQRCLKISQIKKTPSTKQASEDDL